VSDLGLDAGWTTAGTEDEAGDGIAAGDGARGSCTGEVGDEEAGIEDGSIEDSGDDEAPSERATDGKGPDTLGDGAVTMGTTFCMDGNPWMPANMSKAAAAPNRPEYLQILLLGVGATANPSAARCTAADRICSGGWTGRSVWRRSTAISSSSDIS